MIDISNVTLRAQTIRDEDFLLQLFISTRETELRQVGWTSDQIRPFLQQQFTAQHQSYRQSYADADFQIIECQEKAVGRLYLHRGKGEYRIIDIALLPKFRNHSLGRYLIQDIQQAARKNSLPVSLHVEQLNPAIRLYQRLGFKSYDRDGVHLFMRWDPVRDVEIE